MNGASLVLCQQPADKGGGEAERMCEGESLVLRQQSAKTGRERRGGENIQHAFAQERRSAREVKVIPRPLEEGVAATPMQQ